MRRVIFTVMATLLMAAVSWGQDALQTQLEGVYAKWRDSMVRKDASAWQSATAVHRQLEVRNMLYSERRAFPASVFDVPAAPPKLEGLKALQVLQSGRTAKAVYFGKIDFGVGGEPTDNILLLSFVQENTGWKYESADFVNLSALKDVRAELAGGDLSYVKSNPDFKPTGEVPPMPIPVGMAKYIAKVYVFCPGRAVKVQVNKVSHHRFVNAQEAEVVIGGAKDGPNEVQFAINSIEGGTGKEAMTIRVYLAPMVPGAKPLKAFEYQAQEGQEVKPSGTLYFQVTPEMIRQLSVK